MVSRTSGSLGGDSGGGSTAAIASGSVSNVATSVVAHVSTLVASTSRLRSSSSERAPYLIRPMEDPPSAAPAEADKSRALLRLGRQALRWQGERDVRDTRADLVGDRTQQVEVEAVRAGGVVAEHRLYLD